MNYEDLGLREQYNEILFSERDVIEKFLKDQYDIRYGRQRDTWHFEPAVKMMMTDGEHVSLTDIKLDTNVFVMFSVIDSESKRKEYECGYFAYGELSKVIEALPDAEEIVKKNAVNDLSEFSVNLHCDLILQESPFMYKGIKVDNVLKDDEGVHICVGELAIADEHYDADFLSKLRDHINIEVLHKYNEYNKLVKFLSEQPNLRFEPADWGHVMFTIHGTDVKVDVLSASLDSNGKLQLCVDDDGQETIYLEEKDIRPEYLVDLVDYIEDHCRYDIMDTYNGHNPELVRKINSAWRDDKYHNSFSEILLALLYRDHEEYIEKYGEVEDYSVDYAMAHAHEIMEGVCDDLDLECILNFIRYEEE